MRHLVGRLRWSALLVLAVLAGVLTIPAAIIAPAVTAPAAADTITMFGSLDACQTYVVPPDVTQIDIVADGGRGGPGSGGAAGGQGIPMSGRFEVEPGTVLSIVGGTDGGGAGRENLGGGSRRHGGAGGDGLKLYGITDVKYGGGGGGASFVSTDFAHCGVTGAPVDPSKLLLVAGGGGGGGAPSNLGNAGGSGDGGNSALDCFFFLPCQGGDNAGQPGAAGGAGGAGSSTGVGQGGNGAPLGAPPVGAGSAWSYVSGGSSVLSYGFGGGGGGGFMGGGQGGDNLGTYGGGGAGSSYRAPGASDIPLDTAHPIAWGTGVVGIRAVTSSRLRVTTAGTGAGQVTGSGIDCGTTCKAFFDPGTPVTLTAAPAAGSRFVGWTGAPCAATSLTCVVTMDVARSVTATFNKLQRLTLSTAGTAGAGAGTITTSPAGVACGTGCVDLDDRTTVTLTAVPDGSSVFRDWICDGALTTSCVLTMDRARSAVAGFAGNVLTVRKDGTGNGRVTSEPAGIDCDVACTSQSKLYPWGTDVTLTAQAVPGSSVQWLSGGCGAGPTCTFHLEGNVSPKVRFSTVPESLTVVVDGDGGRVLSAPEGIDCATAAGCGDQTRSFDHGTSVELTALPQTGTPSSDTTFVGWSGDCATIHLGRCIVSMDTARTVHAQFVAVPRHQLTVAPAGSGSGSTVSDVGGISCGSTCLQSFYTGTVVTLTATSDTATSRFAGWQGACTNTTGPCSVTVDGVKNVSPVFELLTRHLTVSRAGDGAGSVTAGVINCGTACEADYPHGTTVSLLAAAGTTVPTTFAGWTGPCTNAQPSTVCDVTMDAARSVTATFTRVTDPLTLTVAGTGSGTVTSDLLGVDGAALNCTSSCSTTFDHGSQVHLTAVPTQADSRFTGWSGACTNTTTVCSVLLDQAKSVTANFQRNVLTVARAGGGTGTVTSGDATSPINCGTTCSRTYPTNTQVTLTATAAPDSTFTGWSTGCTNSQPAATCVVTVAGARSITATFKTTPKVTVNLTGTGASAGQVFTPDLSLNCGSGNTACQVSLTPGTSITVNANDPTLSSVSFDGWSGPCTGTGACTFTPTDAVVLTATFTLRTNTFTVVRAGTGSGTVTSTPAGTIDCGTTCVATVPVRQGVSVTATAASGSRFTGWSGACTGTNPVCSVADMSVARRATATFALIPNHTLTVAPTGTGRITVTSDVGGISCPGTCSTSLLEGSTVVLTRVLDNSVFNGWGAGCASTTATTCTVALNADKTISPSSTLNTTFLTVNTQGTLGAGSGTVTSTPAGIACGATCGASFETNSLVKLVAVPAADSRLGSTVWSGITCQEPMAEANLAGVCTVRTDVARTVTATFEHRPVLVTVNVTGNGSGRVIIGSATCVGTCAVQYPYNSGTPVLVTPDPATGSVFTGWTASPCADGAPNCSFLASTSDLSVTAVFDRVPRTLTVHNNGELANAGTVTTPGGEVSCLSGTCQQTFLHGTPVTLIATPDSSTSTFTGWSGACTNTSGPCTVTMDADTVVNANFASLDRTLTVTNAGGGTVQSTFPDYSLTCGTTCSATRKHGLDMVLEATADPGQVFTGWSGACTGTDPTCTVTMNGDQSVTATFLPLYSLDVTLAGSGGGAVTSAPTGIDCGSTCSTGFAAGTVVTLTAAADSTSAFTGWSGDCTGTGVDCAVTVDLARSVTATFVRNPQQLTVGRDGTGSGSVTSLVGGAPGGIDCGSTCSAAVDGLTTVRLVATPSSPLSVFTGWSGDCSGTGTCDVFMDGPHSVTATFTAVTATPPANVTATGQTSTSVAVSWDPVPGATKYLLYRATTAGGPYSAAGSATGTSKVDSGRTPDTDYWYVVKAVTPAGTSGSSSEALGHSLPLPTPPANVVATATTSTSLTVSWDPVPGATTYLLYRATTAGGPYAAAGSATGTSKVDAGRTPDTDYWYVVKAVTPAGTSSSSSEAAGHSLPLPPAPANVVASATTATALTVSWDPVPGATKYLLYRSATSGGPWATAGSSTTASRVDTGRTPASTTSYVVRAVTGAGTSPPSAEVSGTTLALPDAPSGVRATSTTASSVTVTWDPVPGATSYALSRATAPGGPYTPIGSSTVPSKSDSKLVPATPYFYVVTVTTAVGRSAPSAAAPVTTLALPPAPSYPTIVSAVGTSITVSWDPVPGATKYLLYRATEPTLDSFVPAGSTTSTAKVDGGRSLNTTYAYVVRAVTPAGTSEPSAVVFGTIFPPPDAPTNVHAVLDTASPTVGIGWHSLDGESFQVYRGTRSGGPYTLIGTTTDYFFDDTAAKPGTFYVYVVKAINPAGTSAFSAEASVTTR